MAKELSQDSDFQCANYYFHPDDVGALHAHVTLQGFSPTPLQVAFNGMKEFSLQDLDGHLLSFVEDADDQSAGGS